MIYDLEARRRMFPLLPPREALAAAHAAGGDDYLRTEGARSRHQRWVDAGCPIPDVADVLLLTAERETREALLRALGRLPAAVQWHLSRNTVIVSVGRKNSGWQALLPSIAVRDEPMQLIVLQATAINGEGFASLVAHEVSHSWLADVADGPLTRAELAAGWENGAIFARLAREWNMRREALALVELGERRAATLARAWGFTGPASDVERCVRGARLRGE